MDYTQSMQYIERRIFKIREMNMEPENIFISYKTYSLMVESIERVTNMSYDSEHPICFGIPVKRSADLNDNEISISIKF